MSDKKTKIGFIGCGIVGAATLALAEAAGYKDISLYDPNVVKRGEMNDRQVIFISVPVKTWPNGEQDLTILEEALGRCPLDCTVFVRSTVLPGTVDKLQDYFSDIIIHSLPEFLTEKTAQSDAKKLPFICSRIAAGKLRQLFPKKSIVPVETETECEFVKYMHNAFAAVKVGFFNTMNQFAEKNHCHYDECVDAACKATGFIEKTHTLVPGPDGQFGFGGKCLPKDLFAFSKRIEQDLGKETFLKNVLTENFFNRFGSLF